MPVRDMWDTNEGWKFDQFVDFLPADILKMIDSFELQEDPEAIDNIFWNGEASGGFSIKSALQLIRNDIEDLHSQAWRSVWKLPIPQRIRFFLWLVFHDRLVTNTNRVLRVRL